MKTTLVSKENNEVKLTMDFTAEEFEEAVNKVYKKNKGQFAIDGFRKGKAPRSIIERHYGEGVFYEDAINDIFGENYPKAVTELDIEVIDRPDVDFSEIGKGKPFTVTVKVPVFPVVEVKDYFGVEADQIEQEVEAEEVEKEIEALQKRNGRMVVVERPVQDGDTVLLDYSGFVGDEQFEGGTAERQELKIGSGTFIPGFEEQLIDAKSGDKVDVQVKFPEEYQEPKLAGKDAVFHCLIHEVKEEQLPDLDDEFAKDVSEFDTLEELKEQTKKDLQSSKDSQAENAEERCYRKGI
jgi:trigger factor